MNYPMTDLEAREALVGDIYLLKEIYGYSAYELAVKHGFKGSEDEWLYSLNAYSVAVRNGFKGSEEDWLLSLTAYGLAVKNGFEGTLEEWISSIKGEKGEPGTVYLHGDLDALGERITNVANPVDDYDVVNKKYLEEQNSASKDYVDETFVKKDDQLDANDKTVVNVATPVNDTDAVNKKYVHDNFQSVEVEDISADFISQTFGDCNVVAKNAYKQGKVICVDIEFTSSSLRDDVNMVFDINNKYLPRTRLVAPVIPSTEGHYYFNETMNAYVDNAAGIVQVGDFEQTEGFTNNFLISFTYICK